MKILMVYYETEFWAVNIIIDKMKIELEVSSGN